MKLLTFYLVFCLLVPGLLAPAFSGECLAQGGAEGDSLTMSPDLKRVLESPNAAAFGADYRGFLEKWQAKRFNTSLETTLIRAFANFEEKGLRPRFDFKDIFASFHLAIEKRNFGPELMEKLSIAALAISENFEKPFIQQYFKSLRHFLTSMALKKERSYGIYVENADFEIRYTGFDSSGDEEVILPEQEEAPLDEPVSESVYDDSPVLYEPYGPVIEFKKADLVFRNRLDTVVLKGINAYFNFETGELNGIGGTIDWSNVGVPEAFAKLREYHFSINQKVFDFEEVEFQYPGKLPEPVSGKLWVHGNPARNTQDSYPRFVSASANSTIKGLEDAGIEYRGGISFEGRQFYSKSLYDDKSMILCSRADKPRFRAYAASFNFNNADSVVSSEHAEVTLFCGTDSVYHPAVELEFFYGKGYLRLKPAKNGFQTTPFRSSFYNMDVAGDVLNWDMKSDSFNISTLSARTEVPVLLESKNYYNAKRFYGLRELYSFHPLLMAVKMTEQAGGNSFYLAEMADMSHINESLLERTMIDLMAKGLAIYDSTTKLVTLTEKGFHYVKASRKKSDYDDLIIPSITGAGPNITFNTLSGEMTVNGVKEFYVSDSLDVIITPVNSVIKVLENRKIEFDGSLKAGNFEFLGREFTFDYDQFLVNLIEVDSIELYIETAPGKREALSNQLVKTSGVLKINEPDNKSAMKARPEYPIFSSTENATVFFDQTGLLANAYDSTVYFDIPPFELDSVASTDPAAFAFEGTFHSNGIFPAFEENLVIMEDKSLGFLHKIPESGYHLYGTSGKLYGQLRMDQKGMTSPGHIEFLTASLSTESMTFYLDSMYFDKGIEGTIAAGTLEGKSFPSVKLKQYEVNWLAKKDSMKLKNQQEPFSIYDNLGKFDGTLVLSAAGGLKGEGKMDIQGSTTNSKAYTLEETAFEARNSSFTVKSSNPKKPILWADDVKLSYDLTAQNARVSSEVQGRASIEFPFARYKTSIPEAEWDMKNNVITMRKPDDVPLEQSFFYTTRKPMDSLAFNATNATYDIENQEMQIQGIPHIVVADAVITPDSNQVKILENARIQALKNAVVVFDTAVANHRLFNANIEIVSGNRFEGSATYELVTVKDTFAIQFDEFHFAEDEKKGLYTKSSGEVKAEDGVKVSPGFIFKGKVFMHAFRKALELKGAVKLNLKKFKDRNVWIEYFSNDDIEEVILNFDEARTERGSRLNAGLHFNRDEIYLSFITEKRGGHDDDFFIPSGGNLFYDQKTGNYHIANPGKLKDPLNHYAGNMFSYNEDTGEVTFEGKVNFISPFTKGIDLQAAGKGRGNLDSANFRVNAMLTMNLGIPLAALPFMAGDLKKMGEKLGVPRTHDDRSDLIYKVAEFIGDQATKTWDISYQTVPMPLVNASPQLIKDLVITEVNLQWSKQAKAFYSTGKIGLSNVNNIDLNMEMDGFVEIKRTRQGEVINILLRLTDGTWYYFSRDGFGLITCSSNAAYNQAVRDGKKGKSKAYTNTLAEVMEWASNFRKLYLGIEEPYRLLMAEESAQTIKKKQAVEGDGF